MVALAQFFSVFKNFIQKYFSFKINFSFRDLYTEVLELSYLIRKRVQFFYLIKNIKIYLNLKYNIILSQFWSDVHNSFIVLEIFIDSDKKRGPIFVERSFTFIFSQVRDLGRWWKIRYSSVKCGRIRKRLLFEVQDFVRKFNSATDFDSIEILLWKNNYQDIE